MKRHSARALRGSMEVAIPALIVAILGAVVLHRWWALLPAWAAWLAALDILALGRRHGGEHGTRGVRTRETGIKRAAAAG